MGVLSCDYSSYNSRDTGQYKLRDHRLVIQGPGASGTFRVPFEGALLITEGKERSVWQTIQATTLQFDIIIEDDSHIDFITSLVDAKENEYTVQYWRGGWLSFYGIILADEVVKQEGPRHILHGEESPSGRHTITAIDGLTVLQGIPYWDETADAPYNVNFNATNIYRDKIATHIGRCMSDIPTAAGLAMEFRTYWSATPGGANFMDTIWIDGDVFVKQKRGGGWESFSKWEVLKWFCEHFDMRLYFAAGRYIFEQLS